MKRIIFSLSIGILFSCTTKTQNDKDLVAYWSFDDTISSVSECTGSGLTVLNKGAKQVEGYKGKAMEFDGTSVLQVEYAPLLDNFSKGITLAAWIKKNTSSHWNTILSREIDSTWSEYFGLAVFKNLALFSVDPDGKRYINVMDKDPVIQGKWIHLAGTYDNDSLKLFINGRLVRSGFCKGPLMFRDKNPVFIGGNSNDKNHSTLDCFKGCIDDVRIYRRALSNKELELLINQ